MNVCVVQSIHGMVHCGVYCVLPDFVRKREVLRAGPLRREAVIEFDRPVLVCALCSIARI